MNAFTRHYPEIVNAVMKHIIEHKNEDTSIGMIDLVNDFCLKKNVPVEIVGDAIASDVYFKQFLESDMFSRTHKNSFDEW